MNDIPMTLFAWGLDDMQAALIWAIRIAAGVVAFVLGWFLSNPLWRLLYRLVFRKGITGGLLGSLRLGTAALCATAAVYLSLGFGPGGGGGFGFGSGSGSGSGTGSGTGTETANPDSANKSTNGKAPAALPKPRETIDIVVLGGALFEGDDKYYLIRRQKPAVTLTDVEKFLKDKKGEVEKVRVIRIQKTSEYMALDQLDKLLDDQGILHKTEVEASK